MTDEVNPHIPQYISQAPWYLTSEEQQRQQRTLRHQRAADKHNTSSLDLWHSKGGIIAQPLTKFRKGACENCGAITHDVKSCLERPRAKKAKYTGTDFGHDEIPAVDPNLDYDAKRDRYGGFDPETFNDIIEEAQEQALQGQKNRKVAVDLPEDDIRIGEPNKNIVNLRIREDTAKYLLNLDPNSAFYDPKSRSMRGNPLEHLGDAAQYKGDNELRASGLVGEVAAREAFAWEAYSKNIPVHSQAQPTQLEYLFKRKEERAKHILTEREKQVAKKYKAIPAAPPKGLMASCQNDFLEYRVTAKGLLTGVVCKNNIDPENLEKSATSDNQHESSNFSQSNDEPDIKLPTDT